MLNTSTSLSVNLFILILSNGYSIKKVFKIPKVLNLFQDRDDSFCIRANLFILSKNEDNLVQKI
jgi:hypothetical protein